MKTSLMALCLVLALLCPAQAALIDDGEYFFDDSTGYTWMDLTHFDFMTYNEVEVQLQDTEFSIATLGQLEELWSSTYAYDFDYLYDMIGGMPSGNQIAGLFDNELDNNTAGLAWRWASSPIWWLESDFTPYDDPDYNVFKDRDYVGFGIWAVSTSVGVGASPRAVVPEPGTIFLLCLGIFGLAVLGKK